MPYARLEPEFSNVAEIRMGSPFRGAELTLKGRWIPELPSYLWQDLSAESETGRFLALVAWDNADNQPGFKIVVIDKKNKAVQESERISGCCKSLAIVNNLITFETFNTVALSALSHGEE